MKIKINTSALGQSHWYEYVVRFVFGGSVTALAGTLAKKYGPEVGGLFLAFPAIFPAAATLIAKHEKKKEDRGESRNDERAVVAAGLDAIGSALGAVALMAFAIVVWRMAPGSRLINVLPLATLAWAFTSVLAWGMWEVVRRRSRVQRAHLAERKLIRSMQAESALTRRQERR
jgi:hypothetical protein